MRRRHVLIFLATVLMTSGACMQNQGMYHWGSYEDDLVDLYKHPGTEREFAETLKVIIDESRKDGVPAPPGIAAEYAFLNYQAGNKKAAIEYFDIERKAWPESAGLMTTLITRISEEMSADILDSEAVGSMDGAVVEEADPSTGETAGGGPESALEDES